MVIRIFGIVFGDTDIRKNVLHADPVGRRICLTVRALLSGVYGTLDTYARGGAELSGLHIGA